MSDETVILDDALNPIVSVEDPIYITLSNIDPDEVTVVETDPIVGAVNGIVKANGAGTIGAVVSGTDIKTINGESILGAGDLSVTVANETDPVFSAWLLATPPAYPGDIPDQLSDLSDDATHRLVTDTEKSTWNAKLSSESDPVFGTWLSTTPPAYPGDIPTALSDLSEDSTHRTVTDTEKLTWNGKLSSELDPVFTSWLSTTPPAYPGDIPVALSELSDDSTHRLVTDTEKSTWNAKLSSETDPVFGAWLMATPPAYPGDIPTALSELSDDSTHRLVTDTEKSTWNAKLSSETDPVFSAWLLNDPIPTDISDLTDSTGIIPTALADLSDDSTHRLVTDTEKSTWNAKLSSEVDPVFSSWLSTTPPAYPGDIPTDISELTDTTGLIPTALSELSDDSTHRLVTDTEKSTWNAKLSSESDPVFAAWLLATPPAYPGDIPTTLAELSDDSTHRLVTDTEKSTWNAKLSSESDPVVGAVNGIVKANGAGTIGAVVSGTDIKTINSTSLLGSGDISVVATETDPLSLHTDQTTQQDVGTALLPMGKLYAKDVDTVNVPTVGGVAITMIHVGTSAPVDTTKLWLDTN